MTASLDCASATRRLASATLRASSSDAGPAPPPEAGVGAPEVPGEGVAVFNTTLEGAVVGTMGTLGIGAATPEVDRAVAAGPVPPGLPMFFIAASLAAISARFWAMSWSVDT